MSAPTAVAKNNYGSDAEGSRSQFVVPLPTATGLAAPAGQLLKGPVDENGKPTAAALLVGIKLDLEAEVHLTARIKGDICVGLY